MVGNAIGTRLVQLGHEVRMRSRTADSARAAERVAAAGAGASQGRGLGAYLLLWIRLRGALGTRHFNVKVAR